MPWMAVEKDYRFEGPDGPVSLLDLFEGRRQLIVYRFFYDPDVAGWPERGCTGCSFGADQVAHLAHLNARDTTLAYVSRAPQENIQGLKERMGWDHALVHDHGRLRHRLRRAASGTAPTPSSATATRSSAPTSSTAAATSTWAAPGPTSTSRRSDARRSGRTRRRAIRRPRPTSGGTSTTSTGRQVIAHVGGVPVEELLPALSGAGSAPARALGGPALRRGRERHERDAPHGAHVRGARPGGVRRVDQRGGHPPLVARRARLGDHRGDGRPAGRRRGAGGHARPARGPSSTAAAAATRRSTRRAGSRSPGSGTTTTPGS